MAVVKRNVAVTILGKKIDRKWVEYLVFLLIAVVIWYMNALNKDYTADIRFKTEFVDLPTDKVLVRMPDDELTVRIHAQGFTLLKYRLGLNLKPLAIEADRASLRHNPQYEDDYYLLGTSLMADVSSQLGLISVLRVTPDTLHFVFSELVKKQVPVKVMAGFSYGKEFAPLGEVRSEPHEVTVAGPRSLVDTIQSIMTVGKTFSNLKDSLRAELELVSYENIRISPDRVQIVLPVERVTEASVAVPIEAANLPEGCHLKCFPGTVTINCMVPVSRFDKVQASAFRVTVDYDALQNNGDAKAKVTVVHAPEYALDVRYHPRNVDFIIEK